MYHSHQFYGLSKSDTKTIHELASSNDWEPPTDAVMKLNASSIEKLLDELKKQGEW